MFKALNRNVSSKKRTPKKSNELENVLIQSKVPKYKQLTINSLLFSPNSKSSLMLEKNIYDEFFSKELSNKSRKRKRNDESNQQNKKFKLSESKFIFKLECDCFTIISPSVRFGGLYLGKKSLASDLKRLIEYNITYIINCASEIPNYFEKAGIKYKKLKLIDSIESRIYEYFDACSMDIYTSLSTGESVLVHCKEGKSRSVSIVIAFLMRYLKINLIGCMKLLKSKNVVLGINTGFQRSLMDYEYHLFGKNSVNLFPNRRSAKKDTDGDIENQKVIYHYFEHSLPYYKEHKIIKYHSEHSFNQKKTFTQRLITSYLSNK